MKFHSIIYKYLLINLVLCQLLKIYLSFLFLHLIMLSEEQIAQKLNVSIDAVQETLKELDSDITDLNI